MTKPRHRVSSEGPAPYEVPGPMTTAEHIPAAPQIQDAIIASALAILRDRMLPANAPTLCSPEQTRAFLKLKLALLDYESFCVLYLDQQHRVLAFEHLFKGTLTSASVYPREVLKAVLDKGAAAVLFAHNHPSGRPTPSEADNLITERLKTALGYIDVRVLDHIIIGGANYYSYAENGEI